jgi:hypothetical protein
LPESKGKAVKCESHNCLHFRGASGSRAVLFQVDAKEESGYRQVACANGSSTNHYSVGIETTQNELAKMLLECRQIANVPDNVKIKSVVCLP